MRNTKAILALIILALPTVAFAVDNSEALAPTATFTNNMEDTLTATGNIGVDFTSIGAGTITGGMTLAYATSGNRTINRKVTVMLGSTLPAGVTGTVAFTPAANNGTGGVAKALATTETDLVTAIPQFAVQVPKALVYTFSADKGFDDTDAAVDVVFTLIDQ